MNPFPPLLLSLLVDPLASLTLSLRVTPRRRRACIVGIQQHAEIRSCSLARQIRVVRRGHEADGLGCARVHVRRVVRPALNRVCVDFIFIVDDDVVRRPGVALQTVVCLQKSVSC